MKAKMSAVLELAKRSRQTDKVVYENPNGVQIVRCRPIWWEGQNDASTSHGSAYDSASA